MSANKHTPGPWTLTRLGFGEWRIEAPAADGGDNWSVGMAFGAAGFHAIDGEVESEANARLIAAAPDMLDALYKAAAELKLAGIDSVGLPAIRAAVAKAKGCALPLHEGSGE
jgi:hypothetical protein